MFYNYTSVFMEPPQGSGFQNVAIFFIYFFNSSIIKMQCYIILIV